MKTNGEVVTALFFALISGGQKQRVLLARALYRNPQVLFMDETLAQVNVPQEQVIRDGVSACVTSTVFVVIAQSRWLGLG